MENLDKLLDLIDLALNSKVASPEDQLSKFESESRLELVRRFPNHPYLGIHLVLCTLRNQGHISGTDTVEQLRELCISLYTPPLAQLQNHPSRELSRVICNRWVWRFLH